MDILWQTGYNDAVTVWNNVFYLIDFCQERKKQLMKDPKITKYFSQKSHPFAIVFGVVLIIVGFCVWLFLYWPGLCMPLIFAGVVILLWLNMQTKDSEVDAVCSKYETDFRQLFEEHFSIRDGRKRDYFGQSAIPIYTTTYLAEGAHVLSRCGSDGRLRTSVCQCVGIMIGVEEVSLGQQTCSLIGGDVYAPILVTYAFLELSEAVLSESTLPHMAWLTVYDAKREAVFHAQVSNDAESENAVQSINARIQKLSLH